MAGTRTMVSSFDLNQTTLEEIAAGIAAVYRRTDLAHYPLFRWVQIVHDATIMAEDIRRNRHMNAIERAGRVLMRLLDFIGHYLDVHQAVPHNPHFADTVSRALRMTSYEDVFGDSGLREGPTRWIYAKYPDACAKCGEKPCECVVRPWVFEERRENPAPYEKYKRKAEGRRSALKNSPTRLFTLPQLFAFFNNIYRNSYYNQDPWKLAMHLTEELGEATVELSRLELAWLGKQQKRLRIRGQLGEIKRQTDARIKREIGRIRSKTGRENLKSIAESELRRHLGELRGKDPLNIFIGLVSERFKEEIADIFSWLVAVILKLTHAKFKTKVGDIVGRYLKSKGNRNVFKCPWCGRERCVNACLITHGITDELAEKALKF